MSDTEIIAILRGILAQQERIADALAVIATVALGSNPTRLRNEWEGRS